MSFSVFFAVLVICYNTFTVSKAIAPYELRVARLNEKKPLLRMQTTAFLIRRLDDDKIRGS
jgi:hypothetical protein